MSVFGREMGWRFIGGGGSWRGPFGGEEIGLNRDLGIFLAGELVYRLLDCLIAV